MRVSWDLPADRLTDYDIAAGGMVIAPERGLALESGKDSTREFRHSYMGMKRKLSDLGWY